MTQAIHGIRAFIGSKDFERERDLFVALGFRVAYDDGRLALMERDGFSFYLQNYYDQTWCENTMLYVVVDDARAWHDHAQEVLQRGDYGAARTTPPRQEDYGALVTYVWMPSGVLVHFGQFLEE